MTTTDVTIKKITASDDMWLAPVNNSDTDPVFAKVVYLGVIDTQSNWHEITNRDKEDIEQAALYLRQQKIKSLTD